MLLLRWVQVGRQKRHSDFTGGIWYWRQLPQGWRAEWGKGPSRNPGAAATPAETTGARGRAHGPRSLENGFWKAGSWAPERPQPRRHCVPQGLRRLLLGELKESGGWSQLLQTHCWGHDVGKGTQTKKEPPLLLFPLLPLESLLTNLVENHLVKEKLSSWNPSPSA